MVFIDNLIPGVPNNMIYLVVVILILYFCTVILNASIGHLIAFLFSIFIISNLKNYSETSTSNFNEDIDNQLNTLGNPDKFYIDINFVTLFYSFYGWRVLNPSDYDSAIKACNNVLQIEDDTEKGLIDCVKQYEIAVFQSKLCLNFVHGFIFNITEKNLITKLKNILKRLQQLLTRHLLKIQNNCEISETKKERVDINTGFIQDPDEPQPNDIYVSNFDFY